MQVGKSFHSAISVKLYRTDTGDSCQFVSSLRQSFSLASPLVDRGQHRIGIPRGRLLRAAPPFVVFERWESMPQVVVRALRGTAFVLLVLRKIQDQRQRRRTSGVSDPHWQSWIPEDSHRFIFFDGQVTLLPVLGWGYWNRAGVRPFGGGGETKVPHFVRDDRNFVRDDRNFVRNDRHFVWNDRSVVAEILHFVQDDKKRGGWWLWGCWLGI